MQLHQSPLGGSTIRDIANGLSSSQKYKIIHSDTPTWPFTRAVAMTTPCIADLATCRVGFCSISKTICVYLSRSSKTMIVRMLPTALREHLVTMCSCHGRLYLLR